MASYPITLPRSAERNPLPEVSSSAQHLMPNRVLSVIRTGQTLRVLRGCAWVTMDCKDYFLHPGDTLRLKPGSNEAVIEPMRGQMLVYDWA